MSKTYDLMATPQRAISKPAQPPLCVQFEKPDKTQAISAHMISVHI